MRGSGLLNAGLPTPEQTVGYNGPDLDPGSVVDVEDTSRYPINVRTVLNLQRDTLAFWQNLTCFFNKWWFPEPERITLPFCFFHIMKYSEAHRLETSQKRVVMYEPPEEWDGQTSDQRDPVRRGLMQTIVDNIVIQPKEYTIEVVVPFMPFGRFVTQGLEAFKYLQSTLNTFVGNGGIEPRAAEFIQDKLRDTFGTQGYYRTAMTAYDDQRNIMEQPEITDLAGTNNMINKNSLDAMFESGTILQFKTWMGFESRYVLIIDKTAEKRSLEDDVWRVHLKIRELPVLSLTPVRGTTRRVDRTWMVHTTNQIGRLALGRNQIGLTMPYYQQVLGLGDNNDNPAETD